MHFAKSRNGYMGINMCTLSCFALRLPCGYKTLELLIARIAPQNLV